MMQWIVSSKSKQCVHVENGYSTTLHWKMCDKMGTTSSW